MATSALFAFPDADVAETALWPDPLRDMEVCPSFTGLTVFPDEFGSTLPGLAAGVTSAREAIEDVDAESGIASG